MQYGVIGVGMAGLDLVFLHFALRRSSAYHIPSSASEIEGGAFSWNGKEMHGDRVNPV